MTLHLLDRGTTKYTRLELAKKAESIGAQYSFYCTADHGIIRLVCPGQHLPEAIIFLQELITQATLPEDEFYKLKNEQLVTLLEEKTNPFNAGLDLNRKLQYSGHIYQNGVLGTTETVNSITRSDCQDVLRKLQNPGKILLVINGGYPRMATRKRVKELLALLRPGTTFTGSTPGQLPKGKLTARLPVSAETGLILANIAAPAIGNDYALYRCLEAYIGKGLSSPLFIRARDLNGIGYKVGALYDAHQYSGLLTLFIQTNQKNKAELSTRLFDISALTVFNKQQAQRSREYVRTIELKNAETTLSRGYTRVWNKLHNLPENYTLSREIKNITDAKLQKALHALRISNTVIIE